MMNTRVTTVLLAFALVFFTPLTATPKADLLEYDDIHGVMNQMLSQHVETRRMTPIVVQRSLKVFTDQMDYDRVYFLRGELKPYLEPTPAQLSDYLSDYAQDDYSYYRELNELGQQGIYRARRIRSELYKEWEELFALASEPGAMFRGLTDRPRQEVPFVETEAQLRERIRDSIVRFIASQEERFGAEALEGKEERVLKLYERQLESSEDEYLYVADTGVNMSEELEEHYHTVHILKALAKSLDSHSAFFNASEAYDMRVRLEKGFEGVGVVLQEGFDGVVVTRLIKGGPAERSGLLKVDDRLIEVDGVSVVDVPFEKVLELIRGVEGTDVHLKIKRESEQNGQSTTDVVDVTLQREHVVVDESRVDVSWEEVPGGIIGKITLYSFYEGDGGVSSEADIRRALQELHAQGRLRGLILDLRRNTGGFLMQAVKVAGLFISNGVVVTSVYSDGRERVFRDLDGYTYYNGPLVVLTSRVSASAAEIVAQTLQDYGAAIIVGDDHTYGKGSIQHQNITDQNSASFYKVTVGRYYTVSGRTPQIQGVRADIVVPGMLSDEHIGEAYTSFPLSYNTIDASYNDDLDDVDKDVRYWYVKYYLPSLQARTDRWSSLLPELRARSQRRIDTSPEYQQFLAKIHSEPAQISSLQDEGDKQGDIQMDEAIHIVKDILEIKGGAITQTK